MLFTDKDKDQIRAHGIQVKEAEMQLKRFIDGFPDLNLVKPVKPGEGLFKPDEKSIQLFVNRFESEGKNKTLIKFVPASGAASRMFKLLYNYLEGGIKADDLKIDEFYSQLSKFAFYNELIDKLPKTSEEIDTLIEARDKAIVEQLLLPQGLNYGNLPKALLSFHKYSDESIRKAIDEHLYEGALYCADEKQTVRLHFTVSAEHMDLIKDYLNKSVPLFEEKFQKQYEISFSVQDKATDTLAVKTDNSPFRTEDSRLLFRPGGHGALLKNLDEINADIIFIKNVDNVAAEWLVKDTITFKKALAGILLEVQEKVFEYCSKIYNEGKISAPLEIEIITFLQDRLGFKVPIAFKQLSASEKHQLLFSKLNRPIRVCGVVESSNTGGGPFWVQHQDGSESLQLVETAQVNLTIDSQKKVLEASKYANITDLVCGTKNFKGEKFHLMEFRDDLAGFIAEKSQGGKTLKAMELPGLWNGAMSDWNTVFVEVPLTTFNPVKTVLDLLNKEHQGA